MSFDLAILSPLRAELEPALARLGAAEGPVAAPAPARLQAWRVGRRRVVAGWTGMGAASTEAAVAALEGRAAALLHVGCAGGLDPGLDTGALVVCERLLSDGGGEAATAVAEGELAAWLAAALPGGARRGAAVTVDAVVTAPAAKAALRARTGADVVEMESRHAARAARAAGLAVACARVVVDRADEELPDLTAGLDEVGRPRPLALARTLLRRPGATARLPRLARAFGAAQAELARLVEGVLRALGTPGA